MQRFFWMILMAFLLSGYEVRAQEEESETESHEASAFEGEVENQAETTYFAVVVNKEGQTYVLMTNSFPVDFLSIPSYDVYWDAEKEGWRSNNGTQVDDLGNLHGIENGLGIQVIYRQPNAQGDRIVYIQTISKWGYRIAIRHTRQGYTFVQQCEQDENGNESCTKFNGAPSDNLKQFGLKGQLFVQSTMLLPTHPTGVMMRLFAPPPCPPPDTSTVRCFGPPANP